MEIPQSSPIPIAAPRLWRYALGFIVLAGLWVLALELWIQPRSLAMGGRIGHRLLLYLLPCLVAVSGAYVLSRRSCSKRRQQQEEQAFEAKVQADLERERQDAEAAAVLAEKRFTLEVLSLGGGVEHLSHGEVLEALQVPGELPAALPAGGDERMLQGRDRQIQGLSQALGWLNGEWAIPTFIALPELRNAQMGKFPESDLVEAAMAAGLPPSAMVVVESFFAERPAEVLRRLFAFMEDHPELPALCLIAEDSALVRACLRGDGSPAEPGEGDPDAVGAVDSFVAVVLGRKERVRAMRELLRVNEGSYEAMTPFWDREDAKRNAVPFSPTEFLPRPWSGALLEAFTGLQELGHVHRPESVTLVGEGGALGPASQTSAFSEAWKGLMERRSHSEPLARLFYDHGPVGQGRRMAPMERALHELEPDWDTFEQGINLNRSFGDLGANAPYVGLALGVMASASGGSMCACVDLRCEDSASLLMVTGAPARVQGGAEELLSPGPLDGAA